MTITLTPMTDTVPESAAQAATLTNEQVFAIVKPVMAQCLALIEQRSGAIMTEVKKLASSQKVIAGIKVGDLPTKMLKSPAHPLLPKVLERALAMRQINKSVMLVGPAGCGKTTLAEQVAEALGAEFGFIGCTAGMSESWFFGRQTPNGFYEADFSRLYGQNNTVFLADEMDAGDENTGLLLNTALANGRLNNPILGKQIQRAESNLFIAACNTFGKGATSVYTGRNRLDGATLDRFTCIAVDYIPEVEDSLLADETMRDKLRKARKALQERGSSEFISYRKFSEVAALQVLGCSKKEIFETITMPWPQGLAKEVGLS